MTIKKLTKGLLASSILLASMSSQAALITFDFNAGGTNAHQATFTSGGYSLMVNAFDDAVADVISITSSGLGVVGGANGQRLGGGDNLEFTLLGGDTFDFINVLFSDSTSSSNALLSGESAALSFSDLSTETITGATSFFTSQTVDASSFNIEGTGGNGFRVLGVQLNIPDTITDPVSSVPEPTTLAIFSLALAGLFSRKLKR